MSVSPDLSIPIIRISKAPVLNYYRSNDNPQKVCLVYNSGNDTKECHVFLEKVFKAVELDFESQISKLVLENEKGLSMSQHSSFEQHNLIICFGLSLSHLGLKLSSSKYEPIEFNNKRFLWVDKVETIINDPSLKKQLWMNLQQLFPTKS